MLIKLLSFALLASSFSVKALQFQAPLTDTHWQVVETPLMCSLSQSISDFGDAKFEQHSGSELNLVFTTKSYPAQKETTANFEIAEAPWQNIEQRLPLVAVPTVSNQSEFILSGRLAKQALTQLQEGHFPTLRYNSPNTSEEISVLMSTVHLNDSLPAFQECLSNLYPDTFEDMHLLTVHFALESTNLSTASKKALTRLANYVKVDESIKHISIKGHTDNHGRKRLNEPLSAQRAISVKNYLTKECELPEALFSTSAYRDRKPKTTNKTNEGRALNRRAEIELFR